MSPPKLTLVPPSSNVVRFAAGPAAEPQQHDGPDVAHLPESDRRQKLRTLEALLFAAPGPVDEASLATYLAGESDIPGLLTELQSLYAARGVNLVRIGGKWMFRTADDLAHILDRHASAERRLSKAALETLAIIGYHQPVTRAEIEQIRGVSTSKGTLDVLLETGWVRPRGRRRAPGRPLTYGTTDAFLAHFGLESLKDLPGLAELKGAGLLDGNLPPGFAMPEPGDLASLMPDEFPLEAADEDAAADDVGDEPAADDGDGDRSGA